MKSCDMADSQGKRTRIQSISHESDSAWLGTGESRIAAISEASSGDTAVVDVSARQAVRTSAVRRKS